MKKISHVTPVEIKSFKSKITKLKGKDMYKFKKGTEGSVLTISGSASAAL